MTQSLSQHWMTAFTPRRLRGNYFSTHLPLPQVSLAHFHTAPPAVNFRIYTLYAVICECWTPSNSPASRATIASCRTALGKPRTAFLRRPDGAAGPDT
jgi:hypothetical protein